MEVRVKDLAGSLGGGGRYDGLVGMFSGEQVPACGFSLGLERILVVMSERQMFPAGVSGVAADVLVTQWNREDAVESLAIARDLRQSGLRVDVYPEPDKIGKQMKYAATRGIPRSSLPETMSERRRGDGEGHGERDAAERAAAGARRRAAHLGSRPCARGSTDARDAGEWSERVRCCGGPEPLTGIEGSTLMADPLGTLVRTHTCGALRDGDVGADVTLLGWVHRSGTLEACSSSTCAIAAASRRS